MPTYRIAVPAIVGMSIVAASEAEAVAKANKFRSEMTDINIAENKIIGEDEIIGASVAAYDVAVYLDEEVTGDDIEMEEEA